MKNVTELAGRVLVGGFFLLAGIQKIGASYAGTAGYMDSLGVPGSLLPLVIALEIVAGLMIIVGFKVNWAAYSLVGFTLVAAFIFHLDFSDQMQSIMFMKNIAIVGGLLTLAVNGVGRLSIEKYLSK